MLVVLQLDRNLDVREEEGVQEVAKKQEQGDRGDRPITLSFVHEGFFSFNNRRAEAGRQLQPQHHLPHHLFTEISRHRRLKQPTAPAVPPNCHHV